MFTVEEQIEINAPPAAVYRYLSDPANYARWIADVKRVQAPAPLQPGTSFEEVTTLQGQEKSSVGEVMAMEQDRKIVLRVNAVRSGPKLLPTRTFSLQPSAGGTILRWRSEVRVGGYMRLFGPFLPGMFRTKKRGYLLTLKHAVESGQAPATATQASAIAPRASSG